MEHNICRDNLSAYLDGELTPQERIALETHLAGCPDCRAELAGLKSVSGLVRQHVMEPVPPALKGAVLGKPRAARPWLKPVLAFSAAAAAVMIVLNITKPPEEYMQVGFGAREGGSLYSVSTFSDQAMQQEELATAALPAAASVETAAAAHASGAGIFAETKGSARVSSAGSVRGSYAQAKFAPAGGMGGAAAGSKAEAAGRSAAEFRGPVCVQVRNPASLNEADGSMHTAQVFLEKAGAKVTAAEPGRLVFVKNDGTRTTLTGKDCAYGFIFFDGVQDPLVVTDFSSLPASYNKYFASSPGR